MNLCIQAGQAVTYVDEVGVPHAAIVTEWHGNVGMHATCVNLVFVSSDEKRRDEYGRQIERRSSISHESVVSAHGNFWRERTKHDD